MARQRKERELKNPALTIIGEGATERFYFTHLKALRGYRYMCKPRNFSEQSLTEIEKQIERVLADNGIAVCVFDADVTRTRQAEKRKYDEMLRKYAKNPSVIFCDSMPSIEFWFLLHYIKTNRYFESSEEVIKALHRHMPDFSKYQSFLSRENWVTELLRDNKLATAISNAKGIGVVGESYSNLHRLFERLERKERH